MLKAIDKKMTTESIIKVSKMVRDSGIPSVGTLMVGLPGESQEDIEQTLKFMREIEVDLIDVNSYVPLPGTPLFDAMSEDDRNGIDWQKVAYKSIGINFSKTIPPDAFVKYQYRAYKIANNIRKKGLVRIGVKMFLNSITSRFKKSGKRADPSLFSKVE
jgi:radical SAM superfamily enzyme YgiQ (UPF0313 family)